MENPAEVDEEKTLGASVRSVERAVSILTVLATESRPLGVGEIAAAVKLHPATVHRLLSTLVGLGWVERPRLSRYRLGIRMLGLSALGVAQSPLVSVARDLLRRLADFSGWSAYLSVLIDGRVVDLARSPGRLSQAAPAFEFGVGRSQPAYTSADGKLLLAYLPKAERRRLLSPEPLRAYTARTLVRPGDLDRECDDIRARGFAVDRGERWDFLRGVAVPVWGQEGSVQAAMLCFGRFDLSTQLEDSLRQEMTLLAQELSQHLEMLTE